MTKLKSMIAVSLIALGCMISQSGLASSSNEFTDEQAPLNYQLNLGGFENLEDLIAYAKSCSQHQMKNNDEPSKDQTELDASDHNKTDGLSADILEMLKTVPTIQCFYCNESSVSSRRRLNPPQFSVDDSRINFEVSGRVNDDTDSFGIERRQTAKNRYRNGFVKGVGIEFAAYPDPFDTTGRRSTYR